MGKDYFSQERIFLTSSSHPQPSDNENGNHDVVRKMRKMRKMRKTYRHTDRQIDIQTYRHPQLNSVISSISQPFLNPYL